MTPKEFVVELIGEEWEGTLPSLLVHIQRSLEDAHRYRTVRDFAKKLTFNEHPRERSEFDAFDDLVDAQGNG